MREVMLVGWNFIFAISVIIVVILFFLLVTRSVAYVIRVISGMRKSGCRLSDIKRYLLRRKSSSNSLLDSYFITLLTVATTFVVFIAGVQIDSYKSFEGQLTTISTIEKEEGNITTHGDRIDFIATIQNAGNNPISIKRICLVLDNKEEMELTTVSSSKNGADKESYFSNVGAYGLPVGKGEAVRLDLSVEGDTKEVLMGRTLDECFVEDTSGNTYPLEIKQPIYTASDSRINHFSLAENK